MRAVIVFLALCQPLVLRAAETTSAAPAMGAAEVRSKLTEYYFDAARRGDTAMLGEFIRSRYDLNSRTDKGYTALILTAYHGHLEALEQLLSASADPCAQDARGNTALMGALFKGEIKIARRLLAAPCKPDQRNQAGQTAAMYAALFGRTELLREMEVHGADLDATDAAGNSPRSLAKGDIRTGSQ
jgi:uncharacterized protein